MLIYIHTACLFADILVKYVCTHVSSAEHSTLLGNNHPAAAASIAVSSMPAITSRLLFGRTDA